MTISMQGSKQFSGMILEHIPAGVAIYSAENLCLLEANTLYMEMLEAFLAEEWRGGKALGKSMHEWGEITRKFGVIDLFQHVLQNNYNSHTQEFHLLNQQQQATYWNSTVQTSLNPEGQVTHLVHTINDVSEQVFVREQNEKDRRELYEAHQVVEAERKRLRTTLDQVPEGILITEIATGGFSYANQAAADILGIPLEQLLEVPLHQHRWHRSAYSSTTSDGQPILPWNFVVVRALCGENLRSRETLIVQPSGEYVATFASSSPLYGENGLMTSSVIVLQDITAQKSLEQHKNDFLSIANHELRTPITVIQGFAEVLQLKSAQDNSLDSLTRQALASITEQSEHITGLIETMLDISRIEQDHFILHPEHCNLYTIIARAVDTHAITTRDHDIQIKLEGISPEQYLAAYVDRERISQSIHNLLSNAIKYSPSGGHVEVGLRYQPERTHEVQIWVKDQGLGISTDAQPHIFKRFYRASNLDPSISGFGIGLYLVKEIIVRHGGHIWVESSKNHGATFQITLPLNHLTDTTP